MKHAFTLLLSLLSFACWAQADTSASQNTVSHATYERYATMASVSVGFADGYRMDYSLPKGFQKGNTTGASPFYARIEYGVYKHISIAAIFAYDAFYYNFKQNYTGNGSSFTRYRTNNVRIFSGGIAAYYHLGRYIHIGHLDPYVGIGLSLNNIRYSAYPQGDSTLTKIDHTVTPVLKIGARYYISNKFSLIADAGYDKQSIVSLGISCRFFGRKKS